MEVFIHIGPYKTGTTSLQQSLWQSRDTLLNHGILYPKTGIKKSILGPRHYHLADSKDAQMFHLLEQEIAEHAGLQKIVLSAERFSLNVSRLISNLHATELPSPKLVVAVRPEHELARSMYLQIVKGSYSRIKARSSSPMPMDFATWFRKAGHRFGYHQLLAGWAKTYGSESLLFVPYLGTKSSIVEGISGIMGLPIDHMTVSTGMANPSIGHAAARVAVSCGQFGQLSGRIGLNLGRIVERARPKLRKCRLPGYEEAEIKQFFASDRERAFADLAGFRDAYLEASLA